MMEIENYILWYYHRTGIWLPDGQASKPTSEEPAAREDRPPSPSGARSEAVPKRAAGCDERGPREAGPDMS